MGEIHRATVESSTSGMIPSVLMVSKKFAAAIHLGIPALLPLFFPVLVDGSGLGPSLPVSRPETERDAAAKRVVNQALHTWQDRLHLQDWKVNAILVHPSDLDPKTLGNVHWDLNTKEATIRVLAAGDYT